MLKIETIVRIEILCTYSGDKLFHNLIFCISFNIMLLLVIVRQYRDLIGYFSCFLFTEIPPSAQQCSVKYFDLFMSSEKRGGARYDWWINVSCDTIDTSVSVL